MKKVCAALLAACLLSQGAAFAASAPSDWAKNDIGSAVTAKLVPETLQGDWQRPITRAEFCALANALVHARGGSFGQPKENPFTDTENPDVLALYAAGVVSGKGDGLFAPDDTLTRQEAATMLFRLSGKAGAGIPAAWPEQQGEALGYADTALIADWAGDSVRFCTANAVMGGMGENLFDPEGLYTVEQAAITVLRLQRFAAAQDPSALTMSAEGVPMLYSNNPEVLDHRKFEHYGIYTAKTDMPNGEPIDAEYYHWSYMGSYQPMILGIAVTNSGKKTATVEINQRGVGIGEQPIPVSEECYKNFFASEGEEPVTVKAGETKLVVKDTLPGGQMVNARVQLTAQAEGLSMKLVALKQEVGSEYLQDLPRGIDDNAGRTAGRFNFSERRAEVDASTVRNFTICGNTSALWKLNPGEYPQTRELTDPLAIRDTGTANFNYFLNGNFATIYHLDLKNAAGKTLYLRPNDPAVKDTGGRYMLRVDGGDWKAVTASVSKPYEHKLSGDTTVDFLMLGGNYGNIGFHLA